MPVNETRRDQTHLKCIAISIKTDIFKVGESTLSSVPCAAIIGKDLYGRDSIIFVK